MAQPFSAPLVSIAGSVPLGPVQSATIVSEISSKLVRWVATKQSPAVIVPRIQDVSILQGGSVWWCRGQAVDAARAVPVLGALLASLLDYTAAHRAPAGLLYVVARSTDSRHLAPFADLADFHHALSRYAAARPHTALDSLVARYTVECSGLPPLDASSTISDVRRLRRASGVALAQIATDTAIPISLLRELEWGVYTHWKLEHARGALERYAERAGLDSDAVARVVEQEQHEGPVRGFSTEVQDEGSLQEFSTEVQHEGSRQGFTPKVQDEAPPLVDRVLPYAMAGLLVGAVLLVAPGDRSRLNPEGTAMAAAVRSQPAVSVPAPQRIPESPRPAAESVGSPITPVAQRVPRRNATLPPAGRREASSSQRRSPLAKLAHAIAGNGDYKVEPFPRVQEKP